jgi:hypothetical protein
MAVSLAIAPMKKIFQASLVALCVACGSQAQEFLPGGRVLLDAHNCYPYAGQWSNRLDRALATGLPLAIENDLAWDTSNAAPRVAVCHASKAGPEDPTLREYFFEKVRLLIEQTLKEDNRSQWPLITLNINDLRASDPAFFTTLWKLLGDYEAWLCTAPKTENLAKVAPLDVKPILILTSDGTRQFKTFYLDVPVGGRLRAFGAGKPNKEADNFRRWLNYSWQDVEPEGQPKASDWSVEDEARLKALVGNAHRRGYWIRFYTLNGHGPLDVLLQGWGPSYNFGSLEAVTTRWKAAKAAGVDFVASDMYEACAKVLKGK